MVTSPLIIKLIALSQGVKIDEEFTEEPIIVTLPHKVSFIIKPSNDKNSILKWHTKKNEHTLEYIEKFFPLKVIDNPVETEMRKFFFPSGSCLFISPYGNASSVYNGYFPLPTRGQKAIEPERVIECITPILKQRKIDTVFLVGSETQNEDGGIYNLHPFIRLISKNFKVLVGAIVAPPSTKEWIDWTYAVGVDIIWYNLHCFNNNFYQQHFGTNPPYELLLESLIYATGIFPGGCVFTMLTPGLEPVENTIEGIDSLLSKGIIPILNLDPSNKLPINSVIHLFETLSGTIKKYRMNVSRTGVMDHLITPAELTRLTIHKPGKKKGIYDILSRKLLDSAVRGIYKIRRNLRVKEVK